MYAGIKFYRWILLVSNKTKVLTSRKSFCGSSSQTIFFGGDKWQPEIGLRSQATVTLVKGYIESEVELNGVFLYRISFFVLEILTFLYYANEESDNVINCFTKIVKYWIKNISRNIWAVFFKHCTKNVHHKRNRMAPFVSLWGQHSWLQSLSVQNQIPIKWDRGFFSKHTWCPYCLTSSQRIVGSGWSLVKTKTGNFRHSWFQCFTVLVQQFMMLSLASFAQYIKKARDITNPEQGPVLEGSKMFSFMESRCKDLNLMITELF